MYSILLTSLCLAEGELVWEMKAKWQTVCLGMGLAMDFKIILLVPTLCLRHFGFPKACRYSPMTQPGKTNWTLCGTYINNNYLSSRQVSSWVAWRLPPHCWQGWTGGLPDGRHQAPAASPCTYMYLHRYRHLSSHKTWPLCKSYYYIRVTCSYVTSGVCFDSIRWQGSLT